MGNLTVAHKRLVDPHIKARIHPFKIQVHALVFFQIFCRKGSAIQATRIVERDIWRIVRNRIKQIYILMAIVSVKLPAGRNRDFIHFFRIKFRTKKVLRLCNRRKILKTPDSV